MAASLSHPGYHGRYLQIDLNSGTGSMVPIPDRVLREFLGGSGLGVWLLLQFGQAARGALEPEAPLVFTFSPLVGSPLTTSAKFAVVSKSPLTDRINDSLASSGFALAGKKCGCDAIVLVGRAREHVVVLIDDGAVKLEPAGRHWGMTCSAAERSLRDMYGPGYESAVIGPAGENQVHYATISHAGRHAGRGGSGAVLGAKNVKAILVRGAQRCQWADPAELVRIARDLSRRSLGPATAKYRELGTAANLLVFNRLHTLPTRNFQQGSMTGVENLAPESLVETRSKTRASCVACTIGCEHIYGVRNQPGESVTARVEYENLFSLGSLCGISDPDTVLEASRLCDELGIDTISAGGTIAFAMECVERGLLDEPWLRFADHEALLRSLELIAYRRGLGNELAQGSRSLAKSLNAGTISFAPQVKGLELPGYEPRAMQTLALGLAVGARGADHNRSGAAEIDFSDRANRRQLTEDAARLAIETEDKAALLDSLILCRFLRGAIGEFFTEAAEMVRCITAWDVNADELHQIARRIVSAKKLFNIRAGWTPDEDMLPDRFLEEPLPDDSAARLSRQQLRKAIGAYNILRGWTTEGWLDQHHLQQLGLDQLSPTAM